jgi:G protein-coupled receptor 83
MAIIALDRYQALLHPLKRRLSHKVSKPLIIFLIWFVASLLAIPHAIFNRSVELFTYKTVVRCRAVYPGPKHIYRKSITSLTILTQYVLPLSITMFTYVIICVKIYRKKFIGEADEQQISSQIKTKRKTIKMLIIVVIVFAICWLPINLFHLLNDFDLTEISLNAFYFVHWVAMSSVCYNPFIYFWLNKYYREGIKSLFCCRIFKKSSKHRSNKSMLYLKRRNPTLRRTY